MLTIEVPLASQSLTQELALRSILKGLLSSVAKVEALLVPLRHPQSAGLKTEWHQDRQRRLDKETWGVQRRVKVRGHRTPGQVHKHRTTKKAVCSKRCKIS